MKFSLLSDLHLSHGEFAVDESTFSTKVVVILGDTDNGRGGEVLYRRLMSFGHIVIHVLGNHEYYGSSIDAEHAFWKTFETEYAGRFFSLHNEVAVVEGQRFLGTTLWARVPPQSEMCIGNDINDYKLIHVEHERGKMSPLKVSDTNRMHEANRSFLSKNLRDGDVLLTHHAVASLSVADMYKGNALNSSFVGDISNIIFDKRPSLVAHGHVHNSSDYIIGSSRVVANPRGYMRRGGGYENPDFKVSYVLDTNVEVKGVLYE